MHDVGERARKDSPIDSRLWSVVRWGHRRLRFGVSQLVDRALGVRTAYVEPTGLLGADDPDQTLVKPSGWLTLYRAFRWLDVRPNDVMVDFGSGAGRAVLVASLFPFRRVVGVERQASLYELAMDNLAHFRPRCQAPVLFICGDAREYRLPDDVTVVFFYNPFGGETFRKVMAGVLASVDRAPRRLRVIYINPKEHAYLVGTGRCRWVKTIGGLRPTREWARTLSAFIYEVEPVRRRPNDRSETGKSRRDWPHRNG